MNGISCDRLAGSGTKETGNAAQAMNLTFQLLSLPLTYPRVELVRVLPLVGVGRDGAARHVLQDAVLVHDPRARGGDVDKAAWMEEESLSFETRPKTSTG